jgi:hypothetical protein
MSETGVVVIRLLTDVGNRASDVSLETVQYGFDSIVGIACRWARKGNSDEGEEKKDSNRCDLGKLHVGRVDEDVLVWGDAEDVANAADGK